MFKKIFLTVITLMMFGLPADAAERVRYNDASVPGFSGRDTGAHGDKGPKLGFTAGDSFDSRGAQWGFAPSRSETDLEIYYILPLGKDVSTSFRMIYHENADSNIGGPRTAGMVHFRLQF